MPNRILKDSIRRSPEIDQLSWFEEAVFYRMITLADDYGRMDGREVVLLHDLFPMKEDVTKKQLHAAVEHLVSVGLLLRYTVDDMPYLALTSWDKHQTVRRKRERYPAPPEAGSQTDSQACDNPPSLDGQAPTIDGQVRTVDGQAPSLDGQARTVDGQAPSLDGQARTVDGQLTDNFLHAGAESESESESESVSESVSESETYCAEPVASDDSTPPAPPESPAFTLLLNNGDEFPFTQSEVDSYKELYPAIDVEQEFRKMKGWLIANPARRKTRRGIRNFVNSWLSRAQDRAGPNGGMNNGADRRGARAGPEARPVCPWDEVI